MKVMRRQTAAGIPVASSSSSSTAPLFGSVCFLGVARQRTMSFVLLHKYSPNSVSSYLLKALAVADNMFLIAASGVQIYPAMLMYPRS
jgi:hypothetical protein